MRYLVFIIPVLIFLLIILFKVKIKWHTFLHRGFLPKRNNFGLYCYCGTMGNGKTYSLIEYLEDNKNNIVCFSNVHDINMEGLNVSYFTGFNELLKIIYDYDNGNIIIPHDKQCVVLFDELFTELTKHIKVDQDIIEFLAYLRKLKIVILTTCQFWAELPISFRRFCRYQIECKMFNFGVIGILWKRFRDGENMKWSPDDNDFVAPLIENTISKCRLKVANSYNTNERIRNKKD